MRRIRYYITGHGLGHASRSCLIIESLKIRCPRIEVQVVSTAHRWFLEKSLPKNIALRREAFDIGVVQPDSLHMDAKATLRSLHELLQLRPELIRRESEDLQQQEIGLVVCDIPALPMAAARLAGIPAVGIANFSWDWIYEPLLGHLPGGGEILTSLRQDYACADLFLRLPFSPPQLPFPRIVDLPLAGRMGQNDPQRLRRELDIAPEKRLALLSFGGFGLRDLKLEGLKKTDPWVFLTEQAGSSNHEAIRAVPPGRYAYPDLVRSADAVITKPGYGIVSEAILNDTAVLYADRGDFREQSLLIDGLQRYARSLEIPREDLLHGRWVPHLESLLVRPQPSDSLPGGGEDIAAQILATWLR